MSALDVIVAVPGSVVELHEAHAIFDELAGEQALATEGVGRVLADSVKLLGFFIFLGQIERLGHLHLHAEGQFVAVHARREFVMVRVHSGMDGVKLCDQVEVLALTCFSDASGRGQIEDWRALGAQGRALEIRRQIAVAPVRSTSLRIADLGQDDKAR